jgi:predicted acylesterase/phospholipase RssA
MDIPPLRIAMSGGGMKGIAHVGALEVLQAKGLLKAVKEYVGTSAGALMSFCICIGYTITELKSLCLGFDFTLMQSLDPETMLEMPTTFGLDSGENLQKLLRILLKKKGHSADLTFEDLKGIQLRVYAFDLDEGVQREFSATETPKCPIATAVAASMSVPFYFTPVRDPASGHRLIDGGIIAHFPFHHLTAEERAETIGFSFTRGQGQGSTEVTSIISYILKLAYCVDSHQNQQLYKPGAWGHRIVQIDCGGFPSFQFDSATEQKAMLIAAGAAAAEKFLGRVRPAPSRRNSV